MDEPDNTPTPVDNVPENTPEPSNTPSFTVPDAYKDKGWAKSFEGKGAEDFFKAFDNAQSAMGKKYLPPDLTNATDEERARYFESVRPKDASEYALPEGVTENEKAVYAKLLHDAGISKYQGEMLVNKFFEATTAERDRAFSPEGLAEVLKGSFGDKYEERTQQLGNLLKSKVSEQDWALFDKELPNNVQGFVFRVLDGLEKAYGAQEGSAALNSTKSTAAVDVDSQIKELNDKIVQQARDPMHTQKDKDALMKKLGELYKMKGNAK